MIDLLQRYEFVAYGAITLSALALSTYVTLAAGSLSVAAPGLMAIGAYASALLSIRLDVPFVVAVLGGVGSAALAGALLTLPALRLRSLYLALVTIAFVEMVRILAVALEFTGGPRGLSGIPPHTRPGHMIAFLVLLCAVSWRLGRSQLFLRMRTVRQSELAAQAIGIDIAYVRLVAFTASGVIAGTAGALTAHLDLFVSPAGYGFDLVIQMLTALMLGGAGAWYGSLIGGALVASLPEVLRPLATYRSYVYGALLVVVLIYAPGGVHGLATRLTARLRRPRDGAVSLPAPAAPVAPSPEPPPARVSEEVEPDARR